MEPSIFTRIIRGEIPCHKIYEDDTVIAFLDIHPITPGHTLVVPKEQVPFAWDMSDESYTALQLAAKRVAAHLRTVLDVPYVSQQIIGVDVPHTHIHLLPFTHADELRHQPDMTIEPDHAELAAMAARLQR